MVEYMRFLIKHKGNEYYYTDKFLYLKNGMEFQKLAIFDRHFYKLRLFNRVPILEIDGLRMQLIRDFKTPLDYSKEVINALEIKKSDDVLDTCMGLGYTGITASKFAHKVVTWEISEAVHTLAKWNPWSANLFSSANIEIKIGDAAQKIKGERDKTFDVIIHDPPRFSQAPELYSASFYQELYRVMKQRARLFHYVGTVGAERNRRIDKEVGKRLELAGFRDIRYIERLQGLLTRK